MKRKEILQHVIDIFYEQLLVEQINLRYIEEENDSHIDKDTFNFQAAKTRSMQAIDSRMRQIKIATEMMGEIKDNE